MYVSATPTVLQISADASDVEAAAAETEVLVGALALVVGLPGGGVALIMDDEAERMGFAVEVGFAVVVAFVWLLAEPSSPA